VAQKYFLHCILNFLQMDFMVVKKINYEIEKKQQQLFLCKCKNI